MFLSEGALLRNGEYRIVRLIGHGGFGCTYEAMNVALNKRVAIKECFVGDWCDRAANTSEVTVTTSRRDDFDRYKNKFKDEARVLASLEHKGIVNVESIFEENGTVYYVMQYVEGQSVQKLIDQNGPMSEEGALTIMRQVCDALAYVHSKNRLHLDIKPDNIMVTYQGDAYLIDFGVSKQYSFDHNTNHSTIWGHTPGYSAPEQELNDIHLFLPATDIYAIGATLYAMLMGKKPLSSASIVAGSEREPIPANRASAQVREAIEKALVLNRHKRLQTVKEFMDIINSATPHSTAHTEPQQEEPQPTQQQAPQYNPETEPKPVPEPKRKVEPLHKHVYEQDEVIEEKKSSKMPILIVAVVALLAVLLYFGLNTSSDDEINDSMNDVVETNNNIPEGEENGDLGLPSGTKWATCNIGASNSSDYGDYFAWGETETKSSYTENNSKWYDVSYESLKSQGVIDSKGNLTPKYDVATVKWGGNWRMPTLDEIKELKEKCTWTWTTQNGHNGYKVTGPNGNYIFLPAAGCRDGSDLYGAGTDGGCWSSAASSDSYDAYYLIFNSSYHYWSSDSRYYGQSVRPVAE